MTEAHVQQNLIRTQQEVIKEWEEREEMMCQVSRTQALMALDTETRLRGIIDIREARIDELEAKESELRQVAHDERLFALDREEHLHGLAQGQEEDLNEVTEALRLAREELARKDAKIRVLEEQLRDMRISNLLRHLDETWRSWAPKKKKPAPVRPLKRLRQPQIPTRQSLRLLEKKQRRIEESISDCSLQYSPDASPSPSHHFGSEPDLYRECPQRVPLRR